MSKNLLGKVKKKEGENLTPANIEKVIGLLEGLAPITKKEACEILNIAYNTTRLGKIIDEYKEEKAETTRRRRANSGKPITSFEIQTIIEGYLARDSLKEIGDLIYRNTDVVKRVILGVGVPNTGSEFNYANVGLVPEQCISETFRYGQIVWSMKHNAVAMVLEETKGEDNYYKLYVIEPYEHQTKWFRERDHGGKYSGSWAHDLASLDHLAKYGIDIYKPYKTLIGIDTKQPPLGKETIDISGISVPSDRKKQPIRATRLFGNVQVVASKGKPMSKELRKKILEMEGCI